MKSRLVGTHPMVDVMEKVLLSAPDDEILADMSREDIRAASQQLGAFVRRNTDTRRPAGPRSTVAKKSRRGQNILMEFLEQLANSRPDLSPKLQAMFSSVQEPSREDVERLAVELLQKNLDKTRR